MSDPFTEEQHQWLTEFLAKATKPPDQQSSQPSTSSQSQSQSDYMLKEIVWPIFEVLFEDDVPHMHYQQDGAPAHYLGGVGDWLNETFGTKLIGRGGPLEWPARSPDLTPMDFWLWGYLKEKVYAHNPKTVDQLQVVVAQEMSALDPAMIQWVCVRSSYGRQDCGLDLWGKILPKSRGKEARSWPTSWVKEARLWPRSRGKEARSWVKILGQDAKNLATKSCHLILGMILTKIVPKIFFAGIQERHQCRTSASGLNVFREWLSFSLRATPTKPQRCFRTRHQLSEWCGTLRPLRAWVAYDTQYCRETLANRNLNWSRINSRLYNEAFTRRAKAIPRFLHIDRPKHGYPRWYITPSPYGVANRSTDPSRQAPSGRLVEHFLSHTAPRADIRILGKRGRMLGPFRDLSAFTSILVRRFGVVPKGHNTDVTSVWEQLGPNTMMAKIDIEKAKELVAEKGILSSPNPKGGMTLPTKTEEEVKNFYLSDVISCVMPGKKDFVSVLGRDECFLGNCDQCPGTEPIHARLQAVTDENEVDTVEIRQWTTTDCATLETIVLPVDEFIEMFVAMLKKLMVHDFIAKMQARFLQQRKDPVDEFIEMFVAMLKKLMVHDFIAKMQARFLQQRKDTPKEDFGVTIEWHFFATSHGKSAGDGAGGTLKRLVTKASLQRPYENQVVNARQLYHFAVTKIKGMHFGFATLDEHDQEAKLLEAWLRMSRTVPEC
eukprot:Em0825g2a